MQENKNSLIWDINGKFIKQTWHDLFEKINNTHGGIDTLSTFIIEEKKITELMQNTGLLFKELDLIINDRSLFVTSQK